ncbi:MAG: hypothetical protein JW741_09755 [Sedimentisphaerales bacterium]|nr:hypothetical protein [Sedimentisphaerales bacterium]
MYRITQCTICCVVVTVCSGVALGWTNVDVGAPTPGSALFEEATGTWTIAGNGNDIWGNSDNFHFVFKYLVGDGSITARVVAWGDGSNAWAKAGVMMREQLVGGSRHAMTVITAGNGGGGSFQRRLTADGGSSSDSDPSPAPQPPWYVKIERTADEFRAYFSQDGVNWTQHGPVLTIAMRTQAGTKAGCYIGLCVTSHVDGTLRTATFDSVVVEGDVYDAPPPQLEAYGPIPADGTTGVVSPLLQWTAGDTTVGHRVYLGTGEELTEADLVAPLHPVALYFHAPGLVPGAAYRWRVDEVDATGAVHTGAVWSFTAAPLTAFEPAPPPGAKFQDADVDLAWTGGANALTHDVYFSTSEDEVANAAQAAFQGNQFDTGFDPGTLALDTTYYWRVDEIDTAGVRHVGAVWSFTTTIPGLGGVAREIWENIAGTDLDALRNDPRFPAAPTVSDELADFDSPDYGDNYGGRLQAWLHVPVAGPYTFWVAGDDNTELYLGAGPDSAALIAEVPGWTGAQAWDTVPEQQSVPISLEAGRYYIAALWKEGGGGDHCSAAWQGPAVPQRTLIGGSYLKAFEAAWAAGEDPQDGAVDVTQAPMLSWSAGVRAVEHDVYFGDDEEAVANADATTAGIYRGRQPLDAAAFEPGPLAWNATYYWRIDEVNEAHPESPWKGAVWSFATADFLAVDDFESYTNEVGQRVFQTWLDGLGFSEPVAVPGNGSGAIVGHDIWSPESPHFEGSIAQTDIVYSGAQAMPLYYDNTAAPGYSETNRIWVAPQDWTINGVKALTLQFRGNPLAFLETAPGRLTMSAAGSDIWGTADQFRYAHKQLDADGVIVARVESLRDTDVWAKAGVMIRESLDPGSKFAAVYLTGDNGVRFQARAFANATSDSPVATPEQIALREPVWLRLERVGNEFSAFYSGDPDAEGWTPMVWNPQEISMIGSVTVGLALTSHSSGNVTIAEFSGVSVEGGVSGTWEAAEIGVAHASNTPGPLYVALEDAAGAVGIVNHPDPDAVLLDTWQEWNVALGDFAAAGVNLGAVEAMHIGIGDRNDPQLNGAGTVTIDEIRLYKPRCVPSLARPEGDLNADCLVDYRDLELLAGQWLRLGIAGDGRVDLFDFGLLAGSWQEELLWP